jgi:hypothetical protein
MQGLARPRFLFGPYGVQFVCTTRESTAYDIFKDQVNTVDESGRIKFLDWVLDYPTSSESTSSPSESSYLYNIQDLIDSRGPRMTVEQLLLQLKTFSSRDAILLAVVNGPWGYRTSFCQSPISLYRQYCSCCTWDDDHSGISRSSTRASGQPIPMEIFTQVVPSNDSEVFKHAWKTSAGIQSSSYDIYGPSSVRTWPRSTPAYQLQAGTKYIYVGLWKGRGTDQFYLSAALKLSQGGQKHAEYYYCS